MAWTDVETLKRLEMDSYVSPRDCTVALHAQTSWAPTRTTLAAMESARKTKGSVMDMLVDGKCGRGGRWRFVLVRGGFEMCTDAGLVRARTLERDLIHSLGSDGRVNAPQVQSGRRRYVPELITDGTYGGAATARYMRVCSAYLDGARQMN